jgi:hypothetical protein
MRSVTGKKAAKRVQAVHRTLAGLVALVLVAGLSGCDRVAVSPIAVRATGGEIEFMFCESIQAENIRVSTRLLPDDWQLVSDRAAQLQISDKQIVTLSELAGEPVMDVLLQPGEELIISVSSSDETQNALFQWPETEPRGWLTVDGEVLDDPCRE